MYISIGQAAEVIGVSVSTLRRWEQDKSFTADFRTKGGHIRYCLKRIQTEILDLNTNTYNNKDPRITIAYSRVSSADQKLVADVIEIMTVFTAKMHGKRSQMLKV